MNAARTRSIAFKLALVFVAVILPSLFLFAFQCYQIAVQLIHTQTERYISDMLAQTQKNVQMRLESYANMAFNLQIDAAVQNYLIGLGRPQSSYTKYLREQQALNSALKKIIFDDQIASVYIVSDDDRVLPVNKSIVEYPVDSIDKQHIYAGKGSPVWLTSNRDQQLMTVGVQINSLITIEPIGYLIMNIREQYIRSIFADLEFYNEGALVIASEAMRVISSKDQAQINQALPEAYRDIVASAEPRTFAIRDMGAGPCYVASCLLPDAGWRVIFSVPVEFYASAPRALQRLFFMLALGIAAVSLLLFGVASRWLIRPVRKLTRAIQRFGDGDFSVQCKVQTRDEVGVLAANFNSMAHNINDLVDRIYEEELLKQQAELRSLHMQINPHFLYNVLETINWISRIRGVAEIGSIAKALGELMRGSINGPDYIPVADELRNINNYLYIQSFRYGEKLNVSIDVDEVLLKVLVPKLMLQPIVENGVVHGIEGKLGAGSIQITGRTKGGMAVFRVADDGMGMPEDKLRELRALLAGGHDGSSEHIGILNVHRRLRLYCGARYAMSIDSAVDTGTVVTMCLPVTR